MPRKETETERTLAGPGRTNIEAHYRKIGISAVEASAPYVRTHTPKRRTETEGAEQMRKEIEIKN
jgi:hypothetical protein